MSEGEVIVTSSTGGQKGTKLARFGLIPPDVEWELAEIYGLGSEKYADDNWRKGYPWHLSFDAARRHLNQFWNGEDFNKEDFPEGDVKHVLQAAWHCFALAWFMENRAQFDDRPKREDS